MRVGLRSPGLPELGLVVLLMGLYVATLLPGIGYSGDTAKYQFVGHALGIPHATGHPNYLLLNHAFVRIFPFGSLAYKANLLSAVFAVPACLLLYRTLRLFPVSRTAGFVTALAFGFTFSFWSQAVVAEVYTLHLLFYAGVLFLFLEWNESGRDAWFYSGCLLYAVSFGNHLLMITLLPALVFLVWRTNRRAWVEPKRLLVVATFIGIGVAQYAYFIWRSHDPATPYVEIETKNVAALLDYVTGAQFKASMFPFSVSQMFTERLPLFARCLLEEFSLLIPFILLGILRFRNGTRNGFLLIAFAGNLIYSLNFDVVDISVYFIPCYFILAVYLGVGLESVRRWLSRRWNPRRAAVLAVVPVFLVVVNIGAISEKDEPSRFLAREAPAILEAVDRDALLLVPHYAYAEFFWYYLIGEGLRKRNIHVLVDYHPKMIVGYVNGIIPLYLKEERTLIPVGSRLDVYCIWHVEVSALEAEGLRFEPIRQFLFKLRR